MMEGEVEREEEEECEVVEEDSQSLLIFNLQSLKLGLQFTIKAAASRGRPSSTGASATCRASSIYLSTVSVYLSIRVSKVIKNLKEYEHLEIKMFNVCVCVTNWNMWTGSSSSPCRHLLEELVFFSFFFIKKTLNPVFIPLFCSSFWNPE